MNRPLITLFGILLGVILSSAEALGGTYWLSHCNGELAAKSDLVFDGAVQVSVATPFEATEMENYAGNSITSLRVGIISRLKLDGLDVWISSDLSSEPLRTRHIDKESLKSGWNEVLLEEPLDITGETLYLGYTFSQPSRCNVISLVGTQTKSPLYVSTSGEWEENVAGQGMALSIEMGLEGENLSAYNVSVNSFEPLYSQAETGAYAYFRAEVYNSGIEAIENLDYTLSGGEREISDRILIPELQPRQKYSFYVKCPLSMEEGVSRMMLSISSVNGHELLRPAEGESELITVQSPMLRRRVLLEEFSNEYCGNCPEASQKILSVISSLEEPELVDLVVHHAGSGYDIFTVEASKEYEVFYPRNKYSPMLTADRTPYGGNLDMVPSEEQEIRTRIESALRMPAGASLWMEPAVDYEKGLAEVRVHGQAPGLTDLRLTLFLIQNNVKSRNQAGATRDYIHHNMLRSVSSVWGEPVSTDSEGRFSQTAFLEYQHDWTPDDCRLIAFLTSGEGGGIAKVVQTYSLPLLCAEEKEIAPDSGIQQSAISGVSISIKGEALEVEGDYCQLHVYDASGRALDPSHLPSGVSIAVVCLPDGRIITRKIVK